MEKCQHGKSTNDYCNNCHAILEILARRPKHEDLPVHCIDCEWEGKSSECESEWEQEGWEYPAYLVHICPKCGGETEV